MRSTKAASFPSARVEAIEWDGASWAGQVGGLPFVLIPNAAGGCDLRIGKHSEKLAWPSPFPVGRNDRAAAKVAARTAKQALIEKVWPAA